MTLGKLIHLSVLWFPLLPFVHVVLSSVTGWLGGVNLRFACDAGAISQLILILVAELQFLDRPEKGQEGLQRESSVVKGKAPGERNEVGSAAPVKGLLGLSWKES